MSRLINNTHDIWTAIPNYYTGSVSQITWPKTPSSSNIEIQASKTNLITAVLPKTNALLAYSQRPLKTSRKVLPA